MHNDIEKVLITEEQIRDKVQELGRILTEEYKDKAFFRLVLIDPQGNRAYTRPYWYDEFI